MKIKLSEYVMVAEAAAILGVSQGTIRTWAEAGDSQCTKTRQIDTDYFGEKN